MDDFDFLLKQLDSYFINDIDFPHEYDDNHIKSNFVATDNAKIKFDNGTSITFKELMKKEFENTCIDYLYINSLYNTDFCLDGYFVSIPKNHKEVVLFINLFVRRLFIDVDRLFQSVQTSDKIINTSLQNENNKQKKEIEKLSKEIEEKNLKINNQTKTIEELKTTIQDSKNTPDEKIASYLKEIEDLRRQNKKLKNQYDDVCEKFFALEESTEGQNLITTEEESKEIDVNKNYVFVMYDDVTFANTFKNVFPNCSFLSKTVNLNPLAIDAVIFITSHIDHATYLSLKSQCQIKKIPFVHCAHTNTDKIKDKIAQIKF